MPETFLSAPWVMTDERRSLRMTIKRTDKPVIPTVSVTKMS